MSPFLQVDSNPIKSIVSLVQWILNDNDTLRHLSDIVESSYIFHSCTVDSGYPTRVIAFVAVTATGLAIHARGQDCIFDCINSARYP